MPSGTNLLPEPLTGQVGLGAGAIRATDIDTDGAVARETALRAHVCRTRRGAGVKAQAAVIRDAGRQRRGPMRAKPTGCRVLPARSGSARLLRRSRGRLWHLDSRLG